MTKQKKIIIAAVIVILLGAYIGFAIFNVSRSQVDSGIPKDALPVEIESAHVETIVGKIGVKGKVELIEVETVFPQTSAAVKEVYVKEGDQVIQGQLLLEYDGKALEKLEDQLAEAQLALKSAKLNLAAAQTASLEADNRRLENARSSYDNAQTLFTAGAISQQELDTAHDAVISAEELIADKKKSNLSQISILQVSIEQSEMRISLLQKEIESFSPTETSPISGTVIASYIKKGDVAAQGRPLFDLADISLSNLTIIANVPENDARNLALAQEVEIRCNAIGQTVFMGKISKISPTASVKQIGNSQETALTLEISCHDAPLKAGYTVDATIITKTIENAVVVPLMSTIRETDGNNYVYIMRDDYSVEKRLIELGEYAGIYVEAGNIAEGERTVLNPPAQIKDGAFVKPVVIR